MQPGQSAEVRRAFSAQDVADYAELSGHRPEAGVVPEPMINALFSYLLGTKLPGHGTNYLKQESRFTGYAIIDQPLTAKVEISRLRPEKNLVDLRTTCETSEGGVICEGRALVYVEDVAE